MRRKSNIYLSLIVIIIIFINGVNSVEIGQLQALRAIFEDLELKEDILFNNKDEINQILNSDNVIESNSIVTIQDENIIGL